MYSDLDDILGQTIINPDYGCGNPECKSQEKNELTVELVCRVCGWKGRREVNRSA